MEYRKAIWEEDACGGTVSLHDVHPTETLQKEEEEEMLLL